MYRRDYILRMIEEIGQVLVHLRRMILGGAAPAEEVDRELRSAARRGGVDLDVARVATADTLVMLISGGGEADPSRGWLLAELLYLDGLEAETNGRVDAARASYDKALRLYSLVAPAGGFLVGWPEATERMAEIRSRLERLDAGATQ
ncbi:MAG TPA: hypothetical protein VF188_07070 [Longimicrobiales bacterium]